MSKKQNKASLKVSGQLKKSWVGAAGHFYDCGPAGSRLMKNHDVEEIKLSVTKNEFEVILIQLNTLIGTEIYGGEMLEGLKMLESYLVSEFERQIK